MQYHSFSYPSILRIRTLVMLILFPLAGSAALPGDLYKVLELLQPLQQLQSYSYQYQVTNTYPNHAVEAAKGIVYLNRKEKCLFEKGDYSTTLITDQWYYKAEHKEQTVTLVDLERYYARHQQPFRLSELFNPDSKLMPDSLFLKHASLESITERGNIVTVRLKMQNLMNLDVYEISYDKQNNIPVSIYFKYVLATPAGLAWQEMKCTNFKKGVPAGSFSPQAYFEVRHQQAALKQYKTYTIHSEL